MFGEQKRISELSRTLQLEQIRAFFIDIWPLGLQDLSEYTAFSKNILIRTKKIACLIETLALETAASDSEVDKRNTRAQVRRKFDLRKLCQLNKSNVKFSYRRISGG